MEEKPFEEVGVRGKENLPGRLEEFARSPELQEIFSAGISSHIKSIKSENQPTEDEVPDISEALDRFADLKEKVDTGFRDFVLRSFSLDRNTAFLRLANKVDISKEHPSYLDFSKESEKYEYQIAIKERTPVSAFGRSPEEVSESKGFQVEIYRQKVKKHGDVGGIEFQRESGFSVYTSETGSCTGEGTKYDGRTTYKSVGTHDMSKLNKQAQGLNTQIKKLGIF